MLKSGALLPPVSKICSRLAQAGALWYDESKGLCTCVCRRRSYAFFGGLSMKKWLSVILSIVMLSTVLGSGASFAFAAPAAAAAIILNTILTPAPGC